MAVVPVAHDEAGVEVYHQDRGHGGVVPWSAVRFGARLVAGRVEDDRAVLVLPCPVGCGGETAHPAGDDAPEVVRAVATELRARVPDAPRPQTAQEQADATTRTLVVQAASAAVGVNLTALTAGQRNALMAILLWKAGALDPTGVILPLNSWARP